MSKRIPYVLFFAMAALVFSACSAPPQTPETVEITLTEFGIQSPVTDFEVGKHYRFVITNSGALSHEFTIMPPMPTPPTSMEMEGHDMGGMQGALLHVGEDQLTPGAIVTVEFTFSEPTSLGVIEFACHLPAHYEAGMFTSISVNG